MTLSATICQTAKKMSYLCIAFRKEHALFDIMFISDTPDCQSILGIILDLSDSSILAFYTQIK